VLEEVLLRKAALAEQLSVRRKVLY